MEARLSGRVGPYNLLEKLGEGGMGEVWLAEQTEPVERRIALKVIKQGMDTRQVVARFEAEKQALALMDHPAIAKVHDAGATPRGRPYFVMEYVRGVPITEHCDRHELTNKERLRLFLQVCDGVQHAHHKAIIHRDLKPSNVLVTICDGEPVPKIIDFGVAKATGRRLTEQTLQTQLGALIGTPAYMSPEQADMTGQDVDTRADVYALGVMLYELLVGALPFDSEDYHGSGLEAMARKIRETEPPRPSARLTTLGEESTDSARKRRTDLPALQREVSGDLDWITLRAMEKDRARRYSSPQALAADIERYLTDQPVLATPPSAAYRARKFVKRHTAGVIAAAAGLLMLLVFAAAMTVQAGRIAAARDRANAAAERERREAEAKGQVSDFLKNLFTVSDPGTARGKDITARELLDQGSERIEQLDDERTRAELMATMGQVYSALGLYPQAESLLERALAEHRRLLGNDHPDTLRCMHSLADLLMAQARYDEAEPLYLQTLESRKRELGDDDPETLRTVTGLAHLSLLRNHFEKAGARYLEALERQRRVLGNEHLVTLQSMNGLGVVYVNQGRLEESEPLFLEALAGRRRVLGEDHPQTLGTMRILATTYHRRGRLDEAERLFLETVEGQKRVLGDEHQRTLLSVHFLANLYSDQGRYGDAQRLHLSTLEIQRRTLGNDHPDTLMSMHGLADLYAQQGRGDQAERLLLECIDGRRRVLGAGSAGMVSAVTSLAALYIRQGRDAEAEPLLHEALEANPAQGAYYLAQFDAERGRRASALERLRQAIEAGWADADWMARDSALEPLHGPEFDALLARLRDEDRP